MEQDTRQKVSIYEPLAGYFPEEPDPEESNLEETAENAYRRAAKDLHPDRGGDREAFQELVDVWNLVSGDVEDTEDYRVISYDEDFIEIDLNPEEEMYKSDGGEKLEETEEVEEDDRDPMEREIDRELENLNEELESGYELVQHTFPREQDYSLTRIEDMESPLKLAIEAGVNRDTQTFDYETTYFVDGVGDLSNYQRSVDVEEVAVEDENRFEDEFFREIARETVENAEELKEDLGMK